MRFNNIFYIIMIFVVCVFCCITCYFMTRKRGCKNSTAVNYDSQVKIHDESLCVFKDSNCNDDQLCQYGISGCNQPSAYNYDPIATVDSGSCLTKTTFLNRLAIISSKSKAVLSYQDKIIFEIGKVGLNIAVFKRKTLEHIGDRSFRTAVIIDEITNFVDYVNNEISEDDLVVIVSRGIAFTLFLINDPMINQAIFALQSLGATVTDFSSQPNYILIGTKSKDVYYEAVSNETLYYPIVEFKLEQCRQNPGTVQPPSYTFFGELSYADDMKQRCAMESIKANKTSFGLVDNQCVPFTDQEWQSYMSMPTANNCPEGIGQLTTMGGYQFQTIPEYDVSTIQHGVIIFSRSNFTGNSRILSEGSYQLDQLGMSINSIHIPDTFLVYLYYGKTMTSLIGPSNYRKMEDIFPGTTIPNIIEIVVVKITDASVLLCDDNKCLSFNPGRYSFSPYQFMPIKYIRPSSNTKRITIYSDTRFVSEIMHIPQIDPQREQYKVDIPKIIRSVIIE